MQYHADAIVFAKGESPAKTKLYQMGINLNWNEINRLFEVEGFANGNWKSFNHNENYEAFVIRARENL